MSLQKLINDINENTRLNRGKEYNLGNLIDDLQRYRESVKLIEFDDGSIPSDFMSWRGVYNHLALGYEKEGNEFAETIWRKAYNANGSIFEGYKGGEFQMDRDTPIYQANYGEASVYTKDGYVEKKIIGIQEKDDKIIIITRIDED